MHRPLIVLAGFGGIAVAACSAAPAAERTVAIPAPALDVPPSTHSETAVLAGGCFWGMEAVFEQVKGVTSVVSGYAGGSKATARYGDVSTEKTGRSEEHTSELQSLMRISYAVFCLKKKINRTHKTSSQLCHSLNAYTYV